MNLLTTNKVAVMLGMSPDGVRYLERTGQLLAIKVDCGYGKTQRLFIQEDIERFQREREQARELAATSAPDDAA
jgi:DNA-binding transcriptional MerR regulator